MSENQSGDGQRQGDVTESDRPESRADELLAFRLSPEEMAETWRRVENGEVPRMKRRGGKERDPARISAVLELLQRHWEDNPNQRLGQLLCNLMRGEGGAAPDGHQVWNFEDDVLLDRLRSEGNRG